MPCQVLGRVEVSRKVVRNKIYVINPAISLTCFVIFIPSGAYLSPTSPLRCAHGKVRFFRYVAAAAHRRSSPSSFSGDTFEL